MKALEVFEGSCYTSRFTWLFYGDVNQRRIDYIKARVGALSLGQKPEPSKCVSTQILLSSRQVAAPTSRHDESTTRILRLPFPTMFTPVPHMYEGTSMAMGRRGSGPRTSSGPMGRSLGTSITLIRCRGTGTTPPSPQQHTPRQRSRTRPRSSSTQPTTSPTTITTSQSSPRSLYRHSIARQPSGTVFEDTPFIAARRTRRGV